MGDECGLVELLELGLNLNALRHSVLACRACTNVFAHTHEVGNFSAAERLLSVKIWTQDVLMGDRRAQGCTIAFKETVGGALASHAHAASVLLKPGLGHIVLRVVTCELPSRVF